MNNLNKLVLLISVIFLISCNSKDDTTKLANYINPFLCTAGDHGQTDPSANLPFSMIKPGPDTFPLNHSGYDFNADKILGFSQNRASGVGCSGVGGNLRLTPMLHENDSLLVMDKKSEIATAGYYKINSLNQISTEITSTRTAAIYNINFPNENNPIIQIDYESAFSKFIAEGHEVINNNSVQGWIQCTSNCDLGKYKFYYFLQFGNDFTKIKNTNGKSKFYFNDRVNNEVVVKIALSTISEENAKANLFAEIGNKKFIEVKKEAENTWEKYCKSIVVHTSNDTLKTLFYTHLYHSLQTPFNIIDNSGLYRGNDQKVYESKYSNYFSGWSLWDTFRTKLPMISVFYPKIYKDMMSSMYRLYQQGKEDDPKETESFIQIRNEHTIPVLLDGMRKGLLRESIEDIFYNMVSEANNIPQNSPDKILEASYDIWALSEIAHEIGKTKISNMLKVQANKYRVIWKEKFKQITDKSDIMHGDGLYEGTLWQYRWFVPYDFSWVINEIGGSDKTLNQLDYFFENNLFNIGNQPDIHVPFLYYELNEEWKSQKLVRELLLEPTVNYYGTHKKWEKPYIGKIFRNHPEGFIKEMDDDAGTMSAWYVLASIGLYPTNIGEPTFWVLPSIFDKVELNLTDNKKFEIVNIKNSKDDIYIQSAKLNGKRLKQNKIAYQDIINGGKLELILGNNPNSDWPEK